MITEKLVIAAVSGGPHVGKTFIQASTMHIVGFFCEILVYAIMRDVVDLQILNADTCVLQGS